MLKKINFYHLLACGLVCTAMVGCGDDKVSPQEEAKIKKQMTDKFDINNVPPEQRDRVKALMQQSQTRPPQEAVGQTPSKEKK